MVSGRAIRKHHPRYAVDKSFYDRVLAKKPEYTLVDSIVIPPHNGGGLIVKAGHTVRIVAIEGTQVSDVGFWNANNPDEALDGNRTSGYEGWFVQRYSRLWSNLPYFRPMATCIEDTVDQKDIDQGYHHNYLGGQCSPETYELRHGIPGLNACYLMLLQAIEPFGLKEEHIRHSVNIHQKASRDPVTGMRYCVDADSKPGDYVEFYAEMDLLVAASICPNGPGLQDGIDPEHDVHRPLGIAVYDTGIEPKPFPGWTDWRKTWAGRWEGIGDFRPPAPK